jgi:dTMP kinase
MPIVVFEGLDGSGKSTLIKGLADHLKGRGLTCVVTREPGGTPLGDEIRRLLLEAGPTAPIPMAELFLYEAARAQHVEQVLAPARQRGDWVLCDRFTASSLAFQCGGRGLPEHMVKQLNTQATNNLPIDMTVLLDISISGSLNRRSSRETTDRFESEAADFHRRVREHYLRQAAENAADWLVLNSEDMAPTKMIERVTESWAARRWL